MKRCILVGSRTNKDEKTGDELLFLTLCTLPKTMKNGGLFYPKKDELVLTACVNKTRKPDLYDDMLKILPGTLFDLTEGINDFTSKRFVASIEIVPGTENLFDEKILYN